MKFQIRVIILILSFISCASWADGHTNLALHKKYVLTPKPNYDLTTDPSDNKKLTDGVIGESLWYAKYNKKTVGWFRAPVIEITIDLGQICNVGQVNTYTVGGGKSGTEYPEYIAAAIGLDGKHYVPASFSTSNGWIFGIDKAIPKTIVLPVEQKARYVRLYIRPTGFCFFTDEIEVLESQNARQGALTGNFLNKNQITDLVERAIQLQRDSEVLSKRIKNSSQGASNLASNWQLMKENISLLSRNLTETAVSKTEAEFAQFRAKWLRAEYKTEWLCYPTEPMDILRCGDLPQSVPENFQISLYQWKNEHGAATINIVNCSTVPVNFQVHFSPLRLQDKTIESAGVFELRRALYVRVFDAGLVSDPLVLQNDKPFPVAPGQTVQLWLDAFSKGLESGSYVGAMLIESADGNDLKKQQVIPIQLEIANKTFSNRAPIYYFNWDYATLKAWFTSKNPKMAAVDLKNHYINVNIIHPTKIYGKRGEEIAGQYILPSKIESELKLYGRDNFFLFWLGIDTGTKDNLGVLKTSDGKYGIEWKNNFKSLLGQLVAFLKNKGYNYDSFALYLFDESIGDDFIYVAKLVRDFDPKIKIYANNWIESESQFSKVKDLIDIWCPHIRHVLPNKNIYDHYRESDTFDQIWCYQASMSCERFFAPSKIQISKEWRGDNKLCWRTMPIVAVSLGMTGAGFWTYLDANRSGWVKDDLGNWGVVYDGSQNPDKDCIQEAIVPSKRWQQWREGVEDAVCLKGHQELLDEFFRTPSSKLTSEYLTGLRKRADNVKTN
jgi:hypothetical protein